MQRGEVWWASLPDPSGSSPGFRRPVLVVQADQFNRSRIQSVIVAAISSNTRLSRAPGNVEIRPRQSGLRRISVINVSQLLSVDRKLMTERIKSLDAKSMNQVDLGLRLVLAL